MANYKPIQLLISQYSIFDDKNWYKYEVGSENSLNFEVLQFVKQEATKGISVQCPSALGVNTWAVIGGKGCLLISSPPWQQQGFV